MSDLSDRTPRGHDLTLIREMLDLSPAERIARNCEMADWIQKLQAVVPMLSDETRSDLPKPR